MASYSECDSSPCGSAGGGIPECPWVRDVVRLLADGGGDNEARDRARETLGRRSPFADLGAGDAGILADLCEAAGLSSYAVAARRRQLAADPDNRSVRLALSELLQERGEIRDAIEQLEAIPGLAPADEHPRNEPEPPEAAALHRLYLEEGSRELADMLVLRLRAMLSPELAALADQLEASSADSDEEPWSGIDSEETADEDGDPLPVTGSRVGPKDSDLIRMMRLFSGREGIYARQWWNESGQGGYSPVREPMTPRVLQNHIYGNITAGVYPVRQDGTALFFALDLDITKRAMERVRSHPREARELREAVHLHSLRIGSFVRDSGIEPLLEDSGYKGRHLWVFLRQPETSDVLYRLGLWLQQILRPEEPGLHLEFFPKQPKVSPTGVGNLIKLPLGIHRRTGRRSVLLDPQGVPVRDPYAVIRGVKFVDREQLYDLIDRAKRAAAGMPAPGGRGSAGGRQAEARPVSGSSQHEDDRELLPWEEELSDSNGDAVAQLEVKGPEPPEAPPAWTDADFENDAEVRYLLASCEVLAALREQVNSNRKLDHDERVVLAHVFGHRPSGVLAVNYLFDRCVNVPETEKLQTPFSGNPISCPKIRKRIPHVTSGVDCSCDFSYAEDHYPTPLLHLRKMPSVQALPQREPEQGLLETGRRLGVLEERAARTVQEAEETRQSLAEKMIAKGIERLQYQEGAYILRLEAGAPAVLEWIPEEDPGTGGVRPGPPSRSSR